MYNSKKDADEKSMSPDTMRRVSLINLPKKRNKNIISQSINGSINA